MSFLNIESIEKHWMPFSNLLKKPENEKEYINLKSFMNHLVDTAGEDECHPLVSLLDIVGDIIDQYETENDAELEKLGSKGSPLSTLKFLIEQHGLKQKDLKDVFGSQGNVSEILNGKRELSLSHIQKLSQKFHVSPAVFVF